MNGLIPGKRYNYLSNWTSVQNGFNDSKSSFQFCVPVIHKQINVSTWHESKWKTNLSKDTLDKCCVVKIRQTQQTNWETGKSRWLDKSEKEPIGSFWNFEE